ncbi:NAD(P)H-dependent flavin oxidoreductase [Novosphingobium sp. Leaf2]|uniref:NAD(P)H-dependent flavin oxidoreductase n=1 Tax=Novosphingobium sp. Leaf2 TaxID=1735670 RepID=UPI0006F49CD7|nr:nitronate monooxygenase [Novosphingobium sp. Leaf2]KQM18971.1 2-nitropropane dioxygenase [Novosphingobium sp. Leaf2]
MELVARLGLDVPIIQAPMAGTSTPDLAIAVCNAGGLGSVAVGGAGAADVRAMIAAVRAGTSRPFNVNLFVHRTPVAAASRESAWIETLRPVFAQFGAAPPPALQAPYRSLADNPEMLAMLVERAPPVVSFHFGLPSADAIAALRGCGSLLLATATNVEEARAIAAAGLDAIVAQGIEAGGHRGMFDPAASDPQLGVMPLVRLLVREGGLPVIAAGGIMDGAGVAAALDLGAAAAQMGTAFIACPESAADAAYRAALTGPSAHRTTMTSIISGRPARALANRFTALSAQLDERQVPDYPIAYHAGKALNAAASARGEHGFGAQWAGQGAPLARAMPAAELIATLKAELAAARPPAA